MSWLYTFLLYAHDPFMICKGVLCLTHLPHLSKFWAQSLEFDGLYISSTQGVNQWSHKWLAITHSTIIDRKGNLPTTGHASYSSYILYFECLAMYILVWVCCHASLMFHPHPFTFSYDKESKLFSGLHFWWTTSGYLWYPPREMWIKTSPPLSFFQSFLPILAPISTPVET